MHAHVDALASTASPLAALGAAVCYAVCSVLQHRAAGREEATGVGLLVRLVRRPLFLAASAVEALGLGLQALALALGAVAVVQPLLVSGLLFAVPLSARLDRRPVTGREAAGAVLCVAGLAGFLAAARPGVGVDAVRLPDAAPVGGALLAGAVLLRVAASRPSSARGVLLAGASALAYAVSSAAWKLTAGALGRDGLAGLWGWAPLVVLAAGAAGVVWTQSAFQAGALGAPLAVLTIAEPAAAVLLGAVVLREGLEVGPVVVLEAVAALAAAAGVWLLAGTPAARLRAEQPAPVA